MIEKSCKFASRFSAEAALNLLERRECEHVGDLADPTVAFVDQDSREGMSEAVQEAARRIVSEYWVTHGCESARAEAVGCLNAVDALSFPFPPALFFLACL